MDEDSHWINTEMVAREVMREILEHMLNSPTPGGAFLRAIVYSDEKDPPK